MRAPILILVAAIAATSCIPNRDNLADPALAPQLSAVILVNGTLALQGYRNDSIQVAVNVNDPQGHSVSVSVVAFDPRTTILTCPRFAEVPVATVTVSSSQTIAWAKTAFPQPCFSDGPQSVSLKLKAVDTHGFFTDLTLPFLLLDHPPTLPPVPITFVDPSVQTGSQIVGALDGSRAFDPEGDPIRFQWSQLSGAPALFLTTSSLPLNPVTLPNTPSATFRFGVTACDPWICSAQAEVEVRETGALWVSGDTGVVELDGQYGSAQSLLTSAGLITIPATGGTMFPASDGIFVPAPGIPLWRIGPDFSASAVAVPIQTNNLVLLGSDPANDRLWLDTPDLSDVHHFVEVTGTAGTLLSSGIQYVLAASNSPQDPLWLVDVHEHLFEQVAGAPVQVTLTAACSSGLSEIYLLIPSADGSVYLIFDSGTIVHVGVSGVEDACQQPPAGFALSSAIPVPGGIFLENSGVELDKYLVSIPLGSGTASLAVPLAGPPGQIIGGFHDSVNQTETLITAEAEWIYSDDLSTPLNSAVFPSLAGISPLLDGAGRSWELDNSAPDIGSGPMRIWRFGASVSPVLSYHPGVPPQTPDLASVDPLDGKLWVLQGFPTAAIFAFDSLGPSLAQGAPLSIPLVLPGAPMAIRRDAGTCTTSGGAAGCREAGFWIATATTSANLWSVLRVDEEGTVQAGYGNGESQQPGFGELAGFQVSPFDGSLWAVEPNDANGQQQVWRFPVTAQSVSPFIDPDVGVESAEGDVGLGIDASGSLWVADTQDTLAPDGAVKQISPSGTMVSFSACSQFDTDTEDGFPEAVALTPFQNPPLQPIVTCARLFKLGMLGLPFAADVGVERIDPLGISPPIFVSTTSLNATGVGGLNVLVDAASGGVILTYFPGTIRLDAGLTPQPFQPVGVPANLQFPIRH